MRGNKKNADGWIWRRTRTAIGQQKRGKRETEKKKKKKRRLALDNEGVSVAVVGRAGSPDESAAAATAAAVDDEIEGWSDSKSKKCTAVCRHPPLVAFPPLDRALLRPGHVLEIFGPSGSGKTEMLMQAAVSSILPVECNGIAYGGSDGPVLMFDLDGRFDMSRLVSLVRARIDEAHSKAIDGEESEERKNEVFLASLNRFYRLQCFKSFEFLAALKDLDIQAKRIADEHDGKAVQLILIDGIGAFYWLDWMSSCAAAYTNRRTLGVQRFSELIVQELRRIRNTKLFLLLVTKSLLYPASKKSAWVARATTSTVNSCRLQYREYMPAAWQKFVTHRLLLQQASQVFTAQWDKPSSMEQDRFVIEEHIVRVYGRQEASLSH